MFNHLHSNMMRHIPIDLKELIVKLAIVRGYQYKKMRRIATRGMDRMMKTMTSSGGKCPLSSDTAKQNISTGKLEGPIVTVSFIAVCTGEL